MLRYTTSYAGGLWIDVLSPVFFFFFFLTLASLGLISGIVQYAGADLLGFGAAAIAFK